MFFKASIISALLFGLSIATPLVTKRDVAPPARYHLQTKVVGNHKDYGTNKTGLYVYSSHTGAGLGSAGLSSNQSWAWEGYLNGTQQLFTYEGSIGPWPMQVEYGAYEQWTPVTISIAGNTYGYEGFYFNETGLQYNQSTAGWLACDWWYGAPQLFSLSQGYRAVKYTAACSQVELYPIAI